MTKSIGEQNYEQFAQRYAELAPTKPHNAYYERPATVSMIPDITGKRALDVGCGPGIVTEILLDKGAEVVAFDVTPEFLKITQERVGERATVLRANLEEPLIFASDEEFDLVLCSLVLDYIENWGKVFREFYRVLKASGWLIFSCGNPVFDHRFSPSGDYFATEKFSIEWHGFGEPYPMITAYRRPMNAIIQPLIDAGFQLDTFLEPQPVPELEAIDPDTYADLMVTPGFVCIRARK